MTVEKNRLANTIQKIDNEWFAAVLLTVREDPNFFT